MLPQIIAANTITVDNDMRENIAVPILEDHGSVYSMIADIHAAGLPHYPVILVFSTGTEIPSSCVAMPRDPVPETQFPFDRDLASRLEEAYAINHSIHDGAILFQRQRPSQPYLCLGWSFRLAARGISSNAIPNRGSAFNSALAISTSDGIDCVGLIFESSFEFFVDGQHHEPTIAAPSAP